MTDPFEPFLEGFVLKWECDWPTRKDGELTNDPDDPGGTTRWGIDQASHPQVNIRDLTFADAVAIYRQEWQQDGCAQMADDKLACCHFDACVNCGLSRARTFLEAAQSSNWQTYLEAREAFYRRLAALRPRLAKFLTGWLNRTADLRRYLTTTESRSAP